MEKWYMAALGLSLAGNLWGFWFINRMSKTKDRNAMRFEMNSVHYNKTKSRVQREHEIQILIERDKDLKFLEEINEPRTMRTLRESLPVVLATTELYAFWMRGFLAKGGKPTHHYDYDMPDNFVLAKRSFECPEFYGADSIKIIVPKGLFVQPKGSCSAFYLDGLMASSTSYVPMYNDIAMMV